jgi:hypothetical protein
MRDEVKQTPCASAVIDCRIKNHKTWRQLAVVERQFATPMYSLKFGSIVTLLGEDREGFCCSLVEERSSESIEMMSLHRPGDMS